MSRPIVVLYEDSSNKGDVKNFGPHRFVQACLRDRLAGESAHAVAALVEDRPMKGSSRVLADIRAIVEGADVFVVLDDDRIRGALDVPRDMSAAEVTSVVRARFASDRTQVVLLERNIESLLEALRRCGAEVGADALAGAVRKQLNERDKVFQAAAWGPPAVRDCVQRDVPSFGRLIAGLEAHISARFAATT
jgi:hypothetical protein